MNYTGARPCGKHPEYPTRKDGLLMARWRVASDGARMARRWSGGVVPSSRSCRTGPMPDQNPEYSSIAESGSSAACLSGRESSGTGTCHAMPCRSAAFSSRIGAFAPIHQDEQRGVPWRAGRHVQRAACEACAWTELHTGPAHEYALWSVHDKGACRRSTYHVQVALVDERADLQVPTAATVCGVRHERGRRHGGLQRAWAALTMRHATPSCARMRARTHIGMRAIRLVVLREPVRRMPRREAVPAVAAVGQSVETYGVNACRTGRPLNSLTHSATRPSAAPWPAHSSLALRPPNPQ